MKALVTGASGFAGSRLVRALREDGWRVTTLDTRPPADIVADLTRDRLPGLSFDAVFHLAAFSNPSASLRDPQAVYDVNAGGTARLARALRAGRLVLASSCQVYGDSPAADESRCPTPRTPYAASKLCAEALALAAWKDVVILRPFNHTGPGQSDDYVAPRIARQIARAEAGLGPCTITVGALAPRLDLFDVRDMARAYLLAAKRGKAGEIYNVGSGRTWSVREILDMLLKRARLPLRVRSRRGAPMVRAGDVSKFRRDTGWRPEIPLDRTLENVLEFERSRAITSPE